MPGSPDGLDRVGSIPEVRVVILAAAGKVFSSGHDLGEMTGREIEDYRGIFDLCVSMMVKIQSIPQPVIAQVQGTATAAGLNTPLMRDAMRWLEGGNSTAPSTCCGVRIGLRALRCALLRGALFRPLEAIRLRQGERRGLPAFGARFQLRDPCQARRARYGRMRKL